MSLFKSLFGQKDSWEEDFENYRAVFDQIVADSQRIFPNWLKFQNEIFEKSNSGNWIGGTYSAEGYFAFANLAPFVVLLQIKHPDKSTELNQCLAYTYHMLDGGYGGALGKIEKREPVERLTGTLLLIRGKVFDVDFAGDPLVGSIISDYTFSLRLCNEGQTGAVDATIERLERTHTLVGNAIASISRAKQILRINS